MSERIGEFLAMGGYGAFVWAAYATAAVVLVAILVASLARATREERALARLAAAGGRRRGPRGQARAEGAAAEGLP